MYNIGAYMPYFTQRDGIEESSLCIIKKQIQKKHKKKLCRLSEYSYRLMGTKKRLLRSTHGIELNKVTRPRQSVPNSWW